MTARDAGYREGIEAARDAVAQLRQSAACNFTDDNCKGQRGQDRTDALYDAYKAISALPLPSTPDDGKAEPVAWRWRGIYSRGSYSYSETKQEPHPDYPTEPLYTHPSPASDGAIREALEKSRQAIEYSLDMGGTDPAGVLLQALNACDSALSAHAGDAAKESGGVLAELVEMPDKQFFKTVMEEQPGPPDTHAEVKG
jgi:hypothetical protein